ncbi:cupin domain-containing protein [Angustibacter luteus]|uniref:cupin domain-containing protein n=1 Tax=Angustibacter luteus TaxID=658456 RepID=UPI0031E71D10
MPGLTPGHLALPRLVSADPDAFAREVWGHEAWLSQAADLPGDVHDLLDADAVDELVSSRGLRTPFLRVAKNGSTLPDRSFTAGGGIGAAVGDQISDDKLLRLFADGATLVLQGLHRTWPPLVAFCQQLAAELGHPVQANAYVTPPQSQGFDDHYDVHDVFVLQVEGEKRWRIHAPVHEAPLRDQPWTDRRQDVARAAATEPLLDVVLTPGDCLYLPRGFLHAATALGAVSTHLTLGVHTWTRHSLAQQVLDQALASLAADPQVRHSLALGADVADPTAIADDLELIRGRLLDAVRDVDAAAVAQRLAAHRLAAQRAAPVAPLAQLREAAALTDDAPLPAGLALRAHLLPQLVDEPDGGAVLRSRAGDVRLQADQVDSVRELLKTGRADDLGSALARTLLLTGILVAPNR